MSRSYLARERLRGRLRVFLRIQPFACAFCLCAFFVVRQTFKFCSGKEIWIPVTNDRLTRLIVVSLIFIVRTIRIFIAPIFTTLRIIRLVIIVVITLGLFILSICSRCGIILSIDRLCMRHDHGHEGREIKASSGMSEASE